MSNVFRIKYVLFGLAGAASLAASACDREAPVEPAVAAEAAAPVAAAPAAPAAPVFPLAWDVRDTEGTAASGDAVTGYQIRVSGKSGVSAIFRTLAVNAGETVNVDMTVSGDEGKLLRIVLVRHCNQDAGDDAKSATVKLTAAGAPMNISHTFLASYECLRLSFLAAEGDAINAKISDLKIARTKP